MTKPRYISDTVDGMHFGFVAEQARKLCGSRDAIKGNSHQFEAHHAVTVRKALAKCGWIAKVDEIIHHQLYLATLIRKRGQIAGDYYVRKDYQGIPEGSVLQDCVETAKSIRGLFCSYAGSYKVTIPKIHCSKLEDSVAV